MSLSDSLWRGGRGPGRSQTMGRVGRLCALAAGILFFGVMPASGQVRTRTYDGVPLEELFEHRVNGMLLQIPAGYTWPTRDQRGKVIEQRAVGFAFWMPDRRWVETTRHSFPGFRAKEEGRPPPPTRAYVVNVISMKPIALTAPGFRSPEVQFRSTVSYFGLAAYTLELQPFGLVHFWPESPPPGWRDGFLRYRHAEGTDPMALFRCTASHLSVSHPSCQGDVYLAADGLSISLHFPQEALPQWREIVCAARDLFLSWRVAPDREAIPCRFEAPSSNASTTRIAKAIVR